VARSVELVELQTPRAIPLQKRLAFTAPGDPLYPQQWHLANTSGYGINVWGAWSLGITGKSASVAIVDDGLQFAHPDLQPNYNAAGSYDFNDMDADVTPNPKVRRGGFVDDHGTPAGGLCCAAANGKARTPTDAAFCGVGAAYEARVAGIRILGAETEDWQEANGVAHAPNINDIYSNSWGPCDSCHLIEGPRTAAYRAMEAAMKSGRGNKGSLYVWAAGNGRGVGDNCNNDGWASWRYTITIAGLTMRGFQASYSESCAALHVTVPGGGSGPALTTTDLLGSAGQTSGPCMSGFSGTSAAAPVGAGIVALIIDANSNLGWRDVQDVLIRSASYIDSGNKDWQTNGAGLKYSHAHGFGIADATKAVILAKARDTMWPPATVTNTSAITVNQDVKGGDDVVVSYTAPDSLSDHEVEHVEVNVNILHPSRGDLDITLTSPSGTHSYLAVAHSDNRANIPAGWRYTSNVNWGEVPTGKWTLKVSNKKNAKKGHVSNVSFTIFSHKKL